MNMPLRVLIAKPGLDGHDRGARILARALRDQGMEVIYTGLHQTPEQVVETAIQEDVNIIALSILSGAHNVLVKKIMKLVKDEGMDDIVITLGGIIPDEDISYLTELGISKVFEPGVDPNEVIDFYHEHCANA